MLCPVDLATCPRPECQSGFCARADATVLAVCWECGAVDDQGITIGICAACVTAVEAPALETEE